MNEKVIKGAKGFDKNLKCRGFRYEVGKKYKEPVAELCETGFHFYENPIDVLKYYGAGKTRFCEVEGRGCSIDSTSSNPDSKIACTEISIGRELDLPEFVAASIEFLEQRAQHNAETHFYKGECVVNTHKNSIIDVSAGTEEYNNIIDTRKYPNIIVNTGEYSVAEIDNAAYSGVVISDAETSVTKNNGLRGASVNIGRYSIAYNYGYRGVAVGTGDSSIVVSEGPKSVAICTSEYSTVINMGWLGSAVNNGDFGSAVCSGDNSIAVSNGGYTDTINTGHHGVAVNTGNCGTAEIKNNKGIALSLGVEGKAKGALGCWLVLAEWAYINNSMQYNSVQSVLVDGEKIKPDTWYALKDGEVVEVSDWTDITETVV